MSECGKGCMPECEYFVTCGCTSPFNCPYKIEKNYQNSTFTTGNSNFLSGIKKWFMQLVEEGKIPQTPMNYDTASYQMYVAYLEAENAELTMNARQLELTLFTVVRNFKVLPVGLELGKTQKEITDMTFETIEKIKQSINYNAVEQLIKESKDD